MKKPDFPYYLTSFLGKYLPGQKNVSRNTIESYAVTFKPFFFFCESEKNLKTEKITIHTITCQLILEYLDWLETQRGCAISTRNQRLVALHSFFRYVQKQKPECMEEISRILDIPYKKTAKAMVPYLTGDEMRILLSQPDGSTREGFRDLVLLSDGELRETQMTNYFSNLYPIDCAVLSVNAQFYRKYGTLPAHEFLPEI